MFDKSFEEALKLADGVENRDGSTIKATKTSETILINSPAIFTLAIGWQSSQVELSMTGCS